jgi:translation initiation factor 1
MSKPKKSLGLESLGSLVFSTGNTQNEAENPTEQFDEVDPSTIDLRVQFDKKNRNGKAVTLVTGFGELDPQDINDLAKMLKSKCGVGGGAKDGEIFIQGDHVNKVMQLLKDEGFKVKRSGG